MLGQFKIKKYFSFVLFFSLLILLLGCSSDNSTSISCGDLFSEYAEKPNNLIFIECSNGTGQTLINAKYRVSAEHSNEVEQALVEKYGLMKFSDYYHSMPLNVVYLEPKRLTKMNPFYVLRIVISHKNLDLHEDNRDIGKEGFVVNVSVMGI